MSYTKVGDSKATPVQVLVLSEYSTTQVSEEAVVAQGAKNSDTYSGNEVESIRI
jgi:hypothetical protein